MSMHDIIEGKLKRGLEPTHLEVVNESHTHNVPPGSESHFKVVVVAEKFNEQRLINRHRMVNALLAAELAEGIHALALHTMTPEEWFEKAGRSPASPDCKGGSKA